MAKKEKVRQWNIESSSDPTKIYKITLYDDGSYACSCPQWIYRRKDCKHIIQCKAEK